MNMLTNSLEVEMLEKASEMLKAIAHPVRIAIVSVLSNDNELPVNQIHDQLQIEQSVASHHLAILKDRGVLNARRDGKNIFYSLKYKDISKIVECISKCACK